MVMGSRVDDAPARDVCEAFSCVGATFTKLVDGHINLTYKVEHNKSVWILQRVNRIFDSRIHSNIVTVTDCLEEMGIVTPKLIKTAESKLFYEALDGTIWRGLSYIVGRTVHFVENLKQCKSAGRLVATFHNAVEGRGVHLIDTGRSVHDINRHIHTLKMALTSHSSHVAFSQVVDLSNSLFNHLNSLPSSQYLPQRVCHGDLKISNILFSTQDEALTLIDLDTLAYMPWPVELGDAFRSWCATAQEDDPNIEFDCSRFEAALSGYASALPIQWTDLESDHLVQWITRICLELAIRFAADALNETYFGFDQSRFEYKWQHNLQRSLSQFNLARSIISQTDKAVKVVRIYLVKGR